MSKKVKIKKLKLLKAKENFSNPTKKTLDSKKTFRIQTKNLFLTYNPCNLEFSEIIAQLKIKLDAYLVISYLLVQEIGLNEKRHVHVFIKLEKKCHIRNSERLDLIDHEEIKIHGNYQSVKQVNSTIEYLLKNVTDKDDSNQIMFSDDLSNRITKLGKFLSLPEILIKLARENKVSAAMQHVEKEDPSLFFRSHVSIEKSLNSLVIKNFGFKQKYDVKNFIMPPELAEALNSHKNRDYNKSLFILGDPGSGKTKLMDAYLAENEFKPLCLNNIDSLKYFDSLRQSSLLKRQLVLLKQDRYNSQPK